jgi:hypothetical protein
MTRNQIRITLLSGFALVAALIASRPVAAQDAKEPYPNMAPIEQYQMDRDAEIALARSAAPDAISHDASVIVLTRHAVGRRPGSCTLTLCGPSRRSAIANFPSVPRFSLAAGVYTVTFAPATGSPAAVLTTPVQAGADGILCCASSEIATISPNSKQFSISRKAL